MTNVRPVGNRYAVVTGASSGIGRELAKQFADHGFDVLMVAEDPGVHDAATAVGGTPVQADLTDFDSVDRLASSIIAEGRPVDALALNAGVGNAGRFIETPLERDLEVIALNVRSVVHLAKLVLPSMVARGEGRVLVTASVASTMPGPYYATYAASKAFLLSFTEAIRHELKDRGVTVTALMPGPTDTNFFRRAGMQDSMAANGHKDDPAEVARQGFEAMMAGKDHAVVGAARNKVQAVMAKVLPARAMAPMHGRMAEPHRGG